MLGKISLFLNSNHIERAGQKLLMPSVMMLLLWATIVTSLPISEDRWNSPCNDLVTPHTSISGGISSFRQSTASPSITVDLAKDVLENIGETRQLISHMITQIENKLANPDHIKHLRISSPVDGLVLSNDTSLQQSSGMVPFITRLYATLTRIAIFLQSIRTDITNIRDSEEKQELVELLGVLEQGGEWGASGQHNGIYNLLCTMYMARPSLIRHGLDDNIIPARYRPGSETQAEVRDRNFLILDSIHFALLQLAALGNRMTSQ